MPIAKSLAVLLIHDTLHTSKLKLNGSYCFRYETKPALSVPIHVVELTNVPPELRMSAAVPEQEETTKTSPVAKQKPKTWVIISFQLAFIIINLN